LGFFVILLFFVLIAFMSRFFVFILLLSWHITPAQQMISVSFNTGEAILSMQDKKRLDSLVQTFHAERIYHLKLIGHTDSVGSFEGNKLLSQKRATTVHAYLSEKKKITTFEIASRAYTSPIRNNATEEGRAMNRRCDIYITFITSPPAQWKIPVQSFNFKNKTKNILYTRNGCKVYIEPGSFNARENDIVNIRITEYNDPIDFIAGGLPMSYSVGDKTYMYQSEQMMKLEAYIDTIPVKLVKLIGLKCPDVDTTKGVRFYEFRGQENSLHNVAPAFVKGRVEEVQVAVGNETQKEGKKNQENILKETTQVKDQEITEVEDTNENTEVVEKTDADKNKSDDINEEKKKIRTGTVSFRLDTDTGRSFILEPDTGRDGSSYFHYSDRVFDICSFNSHCSEVCDSGYFQSLIEYDLLNVPEYLDFRSYYMRYKNLAYDGMMLKCMKRPEDLYTVKTQFKKRSFRPQLVLTFPSARNNPEYKAFEKTQWLIEYGKEKKKAEALGKIKVSDFRILRFNPKDYKSYPKQEFFIEIKSDSSLFRLAVRGKKKKHTRMAYAKYQKEYAKKAAAFDDSVRRSLGENKLQQLYCLYQMTWKLAQRRVYYFYCRHRHQVFPACFPFSYFSRADSAKTSFAHKSINDCQQPDKGNCTYPNFCFPDWLRYYSEHMDLFQKEMEQLKINQNTILNCMCKPIEIHKDSCYGKWEHIQANPIGNSITYIGLGIYNFDTEMALEKKQYIFNPVYLNARGDTLLKCDSIPDYRGSRKKFCFHSTYTIIPGFNGLLKQNRSEELILLPGKENVLYFIKDNRHYRIYLDLRNVAEYKSNIFVLKDITKEAATLEGLKQELLKR
jgi:hypothetical protein